MRQMKIGGSSLLFAIGVAAAPSALGAELHFKSEPGGPAAGTAAYGWTGFYLGGHVGYGGGSFGPGTNSLPEQGCSFRIA